MATLATSRKYETLVTCNPRHGRVILWSDTEMKTHLEKKVEEEGSFGTVYTVKGTNRDEPKYIIKKFKVRDELYRKIFDNEVHNGRICHPFINPIIVRAECYASDGEHISYFMYPYMKNGNLRHNIEREKKGERLWSKETNSKIWKRCIYQIFQVMNYLHRPVESVRGPVFLRYLTSCSIFLDENFNVKIGDFGVAMEAELKATEVMYTESLETGYYPAQNIEYTASYDIFSAGVVILEILTGEKAKLIGDPKFLYQKYTCEGGEQDLIRDSRKWSEDNGKDFRDTLAEIAVNAIRSDKTMDFFLQKLDLMRLESSERYRKPENSDSCVSCCINPRAQLSLNGQSCEKTKCMPFCLYCLKNHHLSPLMCPAHGETRPPLSDYVYGVLVAGNNVRNLHESLVRGEQSFTARKAVAEMFIKDVEKFFEMLTSKHPFVLGARKDHIEVVKPNIPGKREKMESRIITAFDNINFQIKKALEKNNPDQEKLRLQNSLFIFYFSGHCSKDEGMYLGNEKETLKASTKWIKEMLHMKLGVDQILVILDCCHAGSQDFSDRDGLCTERGSYLGISSAQREKASFIQLNSCDVNEKSQAGQANHLSQDPPSLFTSILCQGWKGFDSNCFREDRVEYCNDCENRKPYLSPCRQIEIQCKEKQIITFSGLREFIQCHLPPSSSYNMNSNVHAQREKNIYLAYYDPFKSFIHIHLKCCSAPDQFWFSSRYESDQKLKEDIFHYAVNKKTCCDVLNAHAAWKLIAIHSKFGREKDKELTSMNDIYQAWSIGHELEARIREDVKRVLHGHVKLSNIRKATSSQQEYTMDHLKISRNYIEIVIRSITEAKQEMKRIKLESSCPMDLKSLIKDILQIIQNVKTHSLLVGKEDKVLKFYLYNEFSVMAIE